MAPDRERTTIARNGMTTWHVTPRLAVYEVDVMILTREWDRRIKRKLV